MEEKDSTKTLLESLNQKTSYNRKLILRQGSY